MNPPTTSWTRRTPRQVVLFGDTFLAAWWLLDTLVIARPTASPRPRRWPPPQQCSRSDSVPQARAGFRSPRDWDSADPRRRPWGSPAWSAASTSPSC
jgi:hypothetical protein